MFDQSIAKKKSISFQRQPQKAWDRGKPELDAARSVRESYHVKANNDEYEDILKNARQKTGTRKCISDPLPNKSVAE